MLFFHINKTRKIIYIVFISIFISFLLSIHSSASNDILAVEQLEISKDIDLKFSRNKVIDEAFKKAFFNLLNQILNSSDINKLKKVKLKEIKSLVENFKIKNEIFRDNRYYANFDVYFNKKKTKYFLEKKNLFYSNPKKISALFLPIIVKQEKLHLFNENIFYTNWLKNTNPGELINYILPLEDADEIINLVNFQENLENLNMMNIAKKYNTKNYILSIISLNQKGLVFFSKVNFEGNKKNSNLVFDDVDINDEVLLAHIINKAQIQLNDIWKDFNVINTSIKLSISLILNSNDTKKISKLENVLNSIDDIRFFSIKKFSLNKTIYEIIYNTDPKKLKKQFLTNGFSIVVDNGYWVVQ